MQENIITIGLGSPTLRILGQEELPGLLVVTVVCRQAERVCPCCGHVTAKVHEYHPQWKQDCPLMESLRLLTSMSNLRSTIAAGLHYHTI